MPVPSLRRTLEQAVMTAYPSDQTASPGDPIAYPGEPNDAIPAVGIPQPRGAPNEQFA